MNTLKIFNSISEIPAELWRNIEDPQSPFADWEFLKTLEDAQCVGYETGQLPRYLTLWEGPDLIAGIVVYIKNHSYGEYIFDWTWADAAARAAISYYPKLVSYIPFTPASCHKLLINPKGDKKLISHELLQYVKQFTSDNHLFSTHFLFLAPEELSEFSEKYFLRHSYQYHWNNNDHNSFNDFLAELKSRKAKQIRRERAATAQFKISKLTGESLDAQMGAGFYELYLKTIERKNAIPYLNQQFFELIFQRMKDRILLVSASDHEGVLAQSLFFYKGEKLFGRYWGPKREREFLHFELCYYQGMDFAIERKFKVFEAGAQGEHKIPRGFMPTLTYSAHHLGHEGLNQAVGEYISEEKKSIKEAFTELAESLPYKQIN